MKKKTQPSTNLVVLASAVLAVILWFVATWFEDDARWMIDVPEEEFASALNQPRGDTPVRPNTDNLSCEQTENSLVQRVEEARYCSTDDDCTLFDYGYPIECLTSVSKNDITALRQAYRDYENSCEYRVYYDCPTGPMERRAVCRQNRCEVDLVDDDILKDQTLRHLGIQDL